MRDEVVVPAEDEALQDFPGAHPEHYDDEDSDDGTEERRLVIVENESESGDVRQDEEEDTEDLQPLDLSVPRQAVVVVWEGHSDASAHVPIQGPVAVVDQGPSNRDSAFVIESPPLVQGQLYSVYVH